MGLGVLTITGMTRHGTFAPRATLGTPSTHVNPHLVAHSDTLRELQGGILRTVVEKVADACMVVPANVTLADRSTKDPISDSMVDPGGSEFVYTPQGRLVGPWVAPVALLAQARRIDAVNVTHKTAVALAAARATMAALGAANAAAATSAGSVVLHSPELSRSPVGATGGEVAVTPAPVTLHKLVRALCYLRYVNLSASVEETISEFQVYLAAAFAITLYLNARRVSRAMRRSRPDGHSSPRVPPERPWGALPFMIETLFAQTTNYETASVSQQASNLNPLSASEMHKVVAGANRMLDDVQRHEKVNHSEPEAREDQKWHNVANRIVWSITPPSAAAATGLAAPPLVAAPTAEAGKEPAWLVEAQRTLLATASPAPATPLGVRTPPGAPVRMPTTPSTAQVRFVTGVPVAGIPLGPEGGAKQATGYEAQNAQIEALQARVQAFQRALSKAAVEIAEQKKKALRVETYVKGRMYPKGSKGPGSVESNLPEAKLTRIRNEQTFRPADRRAESLTSGSTRRSPPTHSPGDLSV